MGLGESPELIQRPVPAQARGAAAGRSATDRDAGRPPSTALATQEESAARLKRRRACLELGQRKEDFELLGLLGQGSYAHVYKARSRHSNRQVSQFPLHSIIV